MPKQRKVPQRLCVGCGAQRAKKELVRVGRTPTGEVVIDPSGKKAGRGAYICPDPACLEAALKSRKLEKALETGIPPEVGERLRERLDGS